MKERISIGQIVGVVVVLVIVVAVAGVLRGTRLGRREPETAPAAPPAGQGGEAGVDCSQLITPARVGPEAFAQYRLGEKLQKGEFVEGEYLGYRYCSHGQPEIEDSYFYADVDILYMFDAETGELALTGLKWGNPSPPAEPTATPVVIPTRDPNAVTVCMDDGTPLVEIGGQEPRQLTLWDIVGGNCAAEMASHICFACGDDARLLVPAAVVPEDEMPALGAGKTLCIDVTTAIALQVEAGGEGVEVAAPEDCSLQLGGGEGVCWICGEEEAPADPAPSAVPTEGVARDPKCAEYLTEEKIGAEEWARYGIAEKLAGDGLQRHWKEGSDVVVCYGHQAVDEAGVGGTELYYMFDVESGVLLRKRIKWRHDLPEHLPPLAISREEAEAMVEGEVRGSYLAFLSPGVVEFGITAPTFREPCWFVSAKEDDGSTCPWMTVINAMTGEVIGRWMQ
jgi:hypothetical protein